MYGNKYITNNMCDFCNKYKSTCNGQMYDLDKSCVNRYCPEFQDRRYTDEQQNNHWHLQEFVNNYNKQK